jgi:UDP-sugar transporter A1/2/3
MGLPMAYVSLAVLACQNSAVALLMRFSRSDPNEKQYLSSTAVLTSEFVKLIVAIVLLMKEGGAGAHDFDLTEMAKTAVPATLYVIQNNLAYLAISNLDAATYQVTYQGKILTTALLSVIMLNKRLNCTKWMSLFLLTAGIATVQLSNMKANDGKNDETLNPMIGLTAVICACCTSGLAGVYFEKILKGSPVSVWARNCHLAGIGIISGFFGMFFVTTDGGVVMEKGFFHGYTPLTWGVVMVGALGGLVTAVVIKYADNILKGFATSLAIIMSCVVSIFLFDFQLTTMFVAGVGLVFVAVYLYSRPDPSPATLPMSK